MMKITYYHGRYYATSVRPRISRAIRVANVPILRKVYVGTEPGNILSHGTRYMFHCEKLHETPIQYFTPHPPGLYDSMCW
jgi:hypothetical protein